MNTKERLIIQVFIGCLIFILSACALVDDPAAPIDLTGTQWRLTSYGEPGSETQIIEETEVTLQFEQEGQAGGSGGCNSYGAQYEIFNGTISFTEMMATEMACDGEGVMDQEAAYFQALRSAESFELIDGELKIWYNDGQSVLNFVSINSS